MKNLLLFLFFSIFCANAQVQKSASERFPEFPACENLQFQDLEDCFYNELQTFIYNNFKIPENLIKENYTGTIAVLFEVTEEGNFVAQSVDAVDDSLISESKRIFNLLPKISPPTYNGKPTYAKYTIKIAVPVSSVSDIQQQKKAQKLSEKNSLKYKPNEKPLTELDAVKYQKFENPQFKSYLNIPFSHSYYSQFDDEINKVGANNHTGSKPYSYNEVSRHYDFSEEYKNIKIDKKGWWGRKIWNENLLEIQGEDYWFALNPIFDLQVGKSNATDDAKTYINTRGIQFKGGLGENLNFTTTVYESQGRFSDYFNQYSETIKPDGGNPAIIPGVGIAKRFKTDSYDFPSAEANLIYAPSKFIDFNLGYGKNFIGDGYRSLLWGDGASPAPFLKFNVSFWKIKYTVNYNWLKDVRSDVTIDGTYASKYATSHYLSLNVSNRWNIGLFESVVWANTNNRGFDMNFLNPIIFLRSVEFSSSSRSGNAMLGFTTKYKFSNQVTMYGQILIDEFATDDMFSGNKSWRNKLGYQLGMKYYHAFNVKNLLLQAEYNVVRPYVYSHSLPITNYGHNNQSLGHQWGSNFNEFVAIARYHYNRCYTDLKFTFGTRGFDFDTTENDLNYGSNIYKDYDDNRYAETNVKVGQGNKTSIFIADIQVGYLINPSTNMKLFGSFIYRDFSPSIDTPTIFKENTSWFSIGFRCDIFNWYFDY